MPVSIPCPQCGSAKTMAVPDSSALLCYACKHEFTPAHAIAPLRIFLSYGHDANEELVRRIKADLEKRGHDVWFDKNDIKFGDDWRREITDGITGSNRVLSFLSKHSTRDPGVCLDEIAIAIGVKGGNIQTILVESETKVKPPASISHLQWLDMHDWKERKELGSSTPPEQPDSWETWYLAKLAEIIRVVESDESRRFAGEIETLSGHLKPIASDSRISTLLRKGFIGRKWLFDAIEQWRNPPSSIHDPQFPISPPFRLFWITGDPGVGKSAFAAHLTHFGRDKVIAAQFVEWDKPDHRDARRVVRSLAFQLATRLPDYRKLLLTLPEIDGEKLDRKDPAELFDYLLANPLKTVIGGGRERLLIVIDALDESGEAGRNPLVEMLARHAPRLPDWLGLVVTSRPESAVQTPLQGLNPFVLDTRTEANRADLRDYLRHQLAPQLRHRPDADRLIGQILEKSEGVFLYAERFCDDVQHGHLSLDRPDQFPQGLGGIFCQWFQRQFPDLEQFRQNIRPALRAILAAREPLPVEILQRLFNWQDEEFRDFTRTLGSLFPVTKEANGEVIKPYHKSLADWLVDEKNAGAYFVSVLEGHRMLADQLRQLLDTPGRVGQFVRSSLPLHLALSEDWPTFIQVMSDVEFLKGLHWRLPDSLLQAAISGWPTQDYLPLAVIPIAFAACATGTSLRAAGFPYLHEDTIESVRHSGPAGSFCVLRKDGTRMPLAEMEPDNERLYAYITAGRKALRCAFDYSNAVDTNRPRTWLTNFLGAHEQLKDELEDIGSYYDRTHFGPSLRASETVFMWDCMLSNDGQKEQHARSAY